MKKNYKNPEVIVLELKQADFLANPLSVPEEAGNDGDLEWGSVDS